VRNALKTVFFTLLVKGIFKMNYSKLNINWLYVYELSNVYKRHRVKQFLENLLQPRRKFRALSKLALKMKQGEFQNRQAVFNDTDFHRTHSPTVDLS
jgi:hypothetical protein